MSKDFDDIYKRIDQSHKELYKKENETSKIIDHLDETQNRIIKDIVDIKKQVKDISIKIDKMLEILVNFSIMLADDDQNLEENYEIEDSDESWVPKDEDFWDNDEEK